MIDVLLISAAELLASLEAASLAHPLLEPMTEPADAPPHFDTQLELRFRITADDVKLLTNAALERHLENHDRRIESIYTFFDTHRTRVIWVMLAAVPLLSSAMLRWIDPGRVRGGIELWLSMSVVSVTYWMLLWRFGASVVRGLIALRPRIRRTAQAAARSGTKRLLSRSLSRALARLEGVHRLWVDPQALHLSGPHSRKPNVVPWKTVSRIGDSERFYRIYTRATERVGRGYLVAKQSSEGDPDAYQAGLQHLLALSPVRPVPDRPPANP